ncbi:MAG: GDP-mannose 4,6-dehydratase [Candidatus Sungbacteria bacterium]|uniref:GDP-mannose 4,6-dehydratase n=1 Tax=Candidatus Sungiibacteriota bacterium TaxID=2750080 RepID=A0A931SCC4_9BACT|nr:GDP-mannose 4,6-dehydratase [Candidatus Sungbacteria bacterium]
MGAFLRGYNLTDGLKKNPCTYEFKNFKTNSATLAMGLWYLVEKTTGQDINLTVETKTDGRVFYSLNILSPTDNVLKEEQVRELAVVGASQRAIARMTGISRGFIRKIQHGGGACVAHYLRKDPLEVKKIIDLPRYEGWFYDLETSSGTFHCGVGKAHVHNSPRRAENFVTRKITKGVARILAGKQKKIFLGNLDAKRDWGYAPEYMEAAWLMLQQEKPEDYVIGTGETRSVREFLEEAFRLAKISNWRDYVEFDSRYLRPTEVPLLVADSSKAKNLLGWQAKTRFRDLAQIMLAADCKSEGAVLEI